MAPKKQKHQDVAASVQKQIQMRPGGVSVAVVWGDDGGGGDFTSVGKKVPKPKPAAPMAQVVKPIVKPKPQPLINPGVPVGAVRAAARPKPKKAPKQQPAAAGAWEEEPVEEFKTVKKEVPKPRIAGAPGSTHGRRLDPNDGSPYNYQQFMEEYGEEEGKQAWEFARPEPTEAQRLALARDDRARAAAMGKVVGGQVATKSKKEIQEEKKRIEKAAKEAKKQAEEARKRREEEARQETEKKTGGLTFTSVQKGVKQQPKGKSMAAQFSQPTVWAPTKGGRQESTHVSVPKQKQERTVASLDASTLAAFKLKQQSMQEESRPPKADLAFKVKVQGKWYSVRDLAEKDGHMAKPIVQVFTKSAEGRCVGGFFISQEAKDWANEHTVDEFWLAVSYLKALGKVLDADGGEERIQPYWGRGDDMTVAIELLKASLAPEKYPTLALRHLVKHGVQLQVVHCDVYDFTRKMIEECRLVRSLFEKLEEVCDTLSASAKFKNPERAAALFDVREKLPKSLSKAMDNLEESFARFVASRPEPGTEGAAEAAGEGATDDAAEAAADA